jgi:hypothetical protein
VHGPLCVVIVFITTYEKGVQAAGSISPSKYTQNIPACLQPCMHAYKHTHTPIPQREEDDSTWLSRLKLSNTYLGPSPPRGMAITAPRSNWDADFGVGWRWEEPADGGGSPSRASMDPGGGFPRGFNMCFATRVRVGLREMAGCGDENFLSFGGMGWRACETPKMVSGSWICGCLDGRFVCLNEVCGWQVRGGGVGAPKVSLVVIVSVLLLSVLLGARISALRGDPKCHPF